MSDQVSHPYKTTGKIIVLYILIFIFLITNCKTKDSTLNDSKHSLTSICSYILPKWSFDYLSVFPNIWTFPLYQSIYYQHWSFCGFKTFSCRIQNIGFFYIDLAAGYILGLTSRNFIFPTAAGQYFHSRSQTHSDTSVFIHPENGNSSILTLCVPCFLLQCVNDQRDAQFL